MQVNEVISMRTKWSMTICLVALIFVIMLVKLYDMEPPFAVKAETKDTNVQNEFKPLEVDVILERMYLDGEYSQETFKETIWSMEDFWAKYDTWQLIDMDETSVVFREQVDDISPLLKTNGYFGITDEGILTIYNGKPQKYNIIHTFFQIDVGKLESRKHEELKEGIPIKNKNRYVEVLETFKSYSLDEKQAN